MSKAIPSQADTYRPTKWGELLFDTIITQQGIGQTKKWHGLSSDQQEGIITGIILSLLGTLTTGGSAALFIGIPCLVIPLIVPRYKDLILLGIANRCIGLFPPIDRLGENGSSDISATEAAGSKPVMAVTKPAIAKTSFFILPAQLEMQSLNLGPHGRVGWDGQKTFKDLFKAHTLHTSHPSFGKHTMQMPSKGREPDTNLEGAVQLGRSFYSCSEHLTKKTRKSHEGSDVMANEAKAQHFLQSMKERWGLKSTFPQPIYWDEQCLYYHTPEGYHTYLTDINNELQFNQSLEICAHDLGHLLREGIAYPELISIFHTQRATGFWNLKALSRIYTAFPEHMGHRTIVTLENDLEEFSAGDFGGTSIYGGFPGEIAEVCAPDHHLYPDLGKAGIRDLGDFVTIEEFVKEVHNIYEKTSAGYVPQYTRNLCTPTTALAHFLSLYQIAFMLIIAKRQQRLENWDAEKIKKSFGSACHTLLVAFLQFDQKQADELKAYIDQAIDARKFKDQMQFCFTKQDRSAIWPHVKTSRMTTFITGNEVILESGLPESEILLPTDEAVIDIWGESATWTGYMSRSGYSGMGQYTPEKGFGRGDLGEDSAPNPLIEGFMAILNFTHLAVKNV